MQMVSGRRKARVDVANDNACKNSRIICNNHKINQQQTNHKQLLVSPPILILFQILFTR